MPSQFKETDYIILCFYGFAIDYLPCKHSITYIFNLILQFIYYLPYLVVISIVSTVEEEFVISYSAVPKLINGKQKLESLDVVLCEG